MSKLFAVAGTSVLEGKCKVRFAKDMARAKVLAKNGHTNIKLVDLPKPMDKAAALAYITSLAQFKDVACQTAIKAAFADDKPSKPMAQKPTQATKAKAAPVVSRSVDSAIKAKNLDTIKATAERIKRMEERSPGAVTA